jgi:hypothetical protein
MANSLDSTLVNKILAQKAITKLQHKLAYLAAFTTDFSDEVRDQRSRVINVPVFTATSAVQTNPTNFETGDTTAVNAPVTLDHVSKSFYITSADFGSGTRLESLADINIAVVANKIEAIVFTLLTEATFGTAPVTGITAGALSVANLKTLWGALPGDYKACVLADSEFKNILPADLNSFDPTKTPSGYGFDFLGHTGNGFASAGTKIVGFAGNRGALAFASAIPAYTPQVSNLLESEVFEVPGLGLSIQSNLWASAGTRNTWGSFDVLFGAAAGDATALKLVKTV